MRIEASLPLLAVAGLLVGFGSRLSSGCTSGHGVAGLARFSPDIEKAGIFLKSNTSLVGPSEGIPMRFPDRRNDHEAKLVIIIGKQGSDIPKARTIAQSLRELTDAVKASRAS